ncbi:hypothetical protein [Pseudomonas sp. zfem002]|uniref:hypothetical protein n=1 Tax=Pseudomonas sp. zfem002 TaxID=3078197 RepID=UPI002928397F|nr:hypothetical protein [Pseudomonas sp. zfem002]MDU9389710.1 hypothetical protein [Pseudomonas sp. zfem002]
MKTLIPSSVVLSLILGALPLEHASADPNCSDPILETKWAEVDEPVGGYFAGKYPSLQIRLNRAGCTISSADTEQIYQELLARHSQDEKWITSDSLKYQLACLLDLTPPPDPITLEPMRRGVSLEAYKKMKNCNTP